MLRFTFLFLTGLIASSVAFAPPPATFVKRSSPSALSMVAIDTSDIKNGLTVEIDGEPYKVIGFSIMKQARGAAKTTIKFKNLMRGNTIENTYRSGEKFETAMIEKSTAQYTYKDEDTNNFFFMDSQSFEEIIVDGKMVDGKDDMIDEGMEVTLVNFKGNVIEIVLPKSAAYTVSETAPNMEGKDKPATLSSGAVISVPGYVDVGELIKVDTEKREFLGRA
mmetsp:Transcript_16713/g.23232  ORF Transcript_16713/g.23232 Transcript_16713/m.23232 type:complete len:221 (-) Transcript_16713:159-821(-)